MTHRWIALALLLAMCGAGAATARTSPAIERYAVWRNDAAQLLAQRGDADSLAAAAALRFLAHGATPRADASASHHADVQLAARASELAPTDAGLAWLRLELCASTIGCDIRDAATTLRWIDADNAAAWLPSLVVAEHERNDIETDRILNEMAQAARVDFHWSHLVVLLFDALKSIAPSLPAPYLPSDLARYQEATAIADLEILPPLSPVGAACRAAAERREPCLKIARLLQHADTLIAQFAGFSLERHWIAPDGHEARALAERRRLLEWRVAAANQADEPILPWLKNARARRRVAAMRQREREEEVVLAILRQNHLPLEPSQGGR